MVVSERDDVYELAADRIAERVVRMPMVLAGPPAGFSGVLSRAPVFIQRQADDGSASSAAALAATATPILLVEDSVTDLASGQMTTSAFLSQLRPAVEAAVTAAIGGGAERSADAAQVPDYRFSYASARDARLIEGEIRQSSPGAASASSAMDYIPIITDQASRAAEAWTGGVESALTGGGTTAEETAPAGSEETGSTPAGISFKARAGGPRDPGSPQAVQGQLGEGRGIEGSVRTRMESAFGTSFSYVRVHTERSAGELASQFNARAFTVGNRIAFGPGEYRPGALLGDSLIAHDLTRLVQQGSFGPSHSGSSAYEALEGDADRSAANGRRQLVRACWAPIRLPQRRPESEIWIAVAATQRRKEGHDELPLSRKERIRRLYLLCQLGRRRQLWGRADRTPQAQCPPGKRVAWETGDMGCTRTETDSEDPCPNSTRACQ